MGRDPVVPTDSRNWPLPDGLTATDSGVRVRLAALPGWPTVPAVLGAVVGLHLLVLVCGGYRRAGVLEFTGVVVPVELLAGVLALLHWLYRPDPVPLAVVRRLARQVLGIGLLLAAAGLAMLGVAVWLDLRDGQLPYDTVRLNQTASYLYSISLLLPLSLVVFGYLGGVLLRVARRADPATPPARLPSQPLTADPGFGYDFGPRGVRFPNVLPVALSGPVGGGVLAALLVTRDANPPSDKLLFAISMDLIGALGTIPLFAGLIWLALLPRVLGAGLTPAGVRGTAVAFLAAGLLSAGITVLAMADRGWPYLPLTLPGVLLAIGVLLRPGRNLLRFAADLRAQADAKNDAPAKVGKSASETY